MVPNAPEKIGKDYQCVGNRPWKPHELCMGVVMEVQQGDMIVMSVSESDLPPHLVGSVRLGHVTLSELAPRLRSVLP